MAKILVRDALVLMQKIFNSDKGMKITVKSRRGKQQTFIVWEIGKNSLVCYELRDWRHIRPISVNFKRQLVGIKLLDI